MNPSGVGWALPDNFSTISSFNHMLMSCFTRDSTKEIISASGWISTAISLWFCPVSLPTPLSFAPLCRISGHKLSQAKQPLWTQRSSRLDFISWTLPPWITRQLGVSPSTGWARGEAGHCCWGWVQAGPEKAKCHLHVKSCQWELAHRDGVAQTFTQRQQPWRYWLIKRKKCFSARKGNTFSMTEWAIFANQGATTRVLKYLMHSWTICN